MDIPIAVRLRPQTGAIAHAVAVDPAAARQLATRSRDPGPAVLVVRKLSLLETAGAGLLDPADVLAVTEGDWSRTVVVVADEPARARTAPAPLASGDGAFVEEVRAKAPGLADLAALAVALVRARGVEGSLRREGGGRWVNRPNNCVTLKAQPRVSNLHFTLYGNPEVFGAGDFLLQDQNSYSRGWIRTEGDAERFADLVARSDARRRR